eukprot:1558444-Rhodomonas_salina.3
MIAVVVVMMQSSESGAGRCGAWSSSRQRNGYADASSLRLRNLLKEQSVTDVDDRTERPELSTVQQSTQESQTSMSGNGKQQMQQVVPAQRPAPLLPSA